MTFHQLLLTSNETLSDNLHAALSSNGCKIVNNTRDLGSALFQIAAVRPDILIVDLELPGTLGMEIAEQGKALFNRMKVVLLLPPDNRERIYASLTSQADGYCLKNIPAAQLPALLEAVQNGETVLHQDFMHQISGLLS